VRIAVDEIGWRPARMVAVANGIDLVNVIGHGFPLQRDRSF
jgi:hypothetical protein